LLNEKFLMKAEENFLQVKGKALVNKQFVSLAKIVL